MNLQPPRHDLAPYFVRLVEPYRDYCQTISRRSMALAIETCCYLWWVCDQTKATRVADLGSGFSSYVLRRYAADRDVEVASVDDSGHWLRQTADFLFRQGIAPNGLHTHEGWRASDTRYDVIVHDIAEGDTREEWMAVAADHLAPGGVLIFDDAQNRSHHLNMGRVAREYGLTLLDVFEQTVDEIGRYAAVAT